MTSIDANDRIDAECPRRHKSEAEAMFPGIASDGLLVIPTCQVSARARERERTEAD